MVVVAVSPPSVIPRNPSCPGGVQRCASTRHSSPSAPRTRHCSRLPSSTQRPWASWERSTAAVPGSWGSPLRATALTSIRTGPRGRQRSWRQRSGWLPGSNTPASTNCTAAPAAPDSAPSRRRLSSPGSCWSSRRARQLRGRGAASADGSRRVAGGRNSTRHCRNASSHRPTGSCRDGSAGSVTPGGAAARPGSARTNSSGTNPSGARPSARAAPGFSSRSRRRTCRCR